MPIILDCRPDQQFVIFRHIGAVPDDEFLAFYKKFFEDPKAADYLNVLVDLEGASSVVRSSEALQSLADFLSFELTESPGRRKVAVIAPADVSFGLARMYEAFSSDVPWEFAVFRDRGAALDWLGVAHEASDASDAQQASKEDK